MSEIVLRHGHVIDPANGVDAIADVRIAGGVIEAVQRDLPARPGDREIDLTGLLVTPGIIDMHAHVAHTHSRSTLSLHPLVNTLSSGVTTVVDAGTTGWRDFAQFRHDVIDAPRSKLRVLSYVNIVGSGMGGEWEHEACEMDPKLAADTATMHADVVVGIKTAHYWARRRFDDAHPAWLAVDRAVEAAERCGMPLMVDFFPALPERPYEDLILKKMRPGDIHTHVFAQQFPVVDDAGTVLPYMHEARERGIIFDVGHGAGSFWFRHAVPAIQNGFVPDSISTDLHTGNVAGVVIDMLTTMNKVLTIGVPLNDVIAKSTVAPAREINRPELGTLSPGGPADVAVLALDEGSFTYVDCERTTMTGPQRLRCEMTVYGGEIVYNPNGRGLPTWEQDARDNPLPLHVRSQQF
ncbi:MAG TPA: amidohydrolase/deacetylase family metallohydrolase [Thermomicrobiales bacterium]|nr:amidohydrolase/deacetylase family metallohydrolase [Thermomicrobiales bacterium]